MSTSLWHKRLALVSELLGVVGREVAVSPQVQLQPQNTMHDCIKIFERFEKHKPAKSLPCLALSCSQRRAWPVVFRVAIRQEEGLPPPNLKDTHTRLNKTYVRLRKHLHSPWPTSSLVSQCKSVAYCLPSREYSTLRRNCRLSTSTWNAPNDSLIWSS